MLLRIVLAIAMTAFCLWQGLVSASMPSDAGRHYFPFLYVAVPLLLWSGLNRRGLLTWPLATVLLLLRGHWVVGWIPVGLVVFNLVGNELARRRWRA